MIPVELTIQGLYSYRERQTIRFDMLTDAGLFGIFGGVGSGKSSLLEAITFALYSKTERLNISGDNRYYNMMNLKSNEMYIAFIFKTGKDNTLYKATAECKRNKKQFDKTAPIHYAAYKKEEGAWQPIEHHTLADIIGLSYENFKRTIIIPQGKFQEFLQLGSSDRTRMMKELFSLERFDLAAKTKRLEETNQGKLQNIRGQLQQLGEIKQEDIDLCNSQLKALQENLSLAESSLEKWKKEEAGLEQLKELFEKHKEEKNVLTALLQQEESISQLEKDISAFESCNLQFKALLERSRESQNKVDQLKKHMESDGQLLEKSLKHIEKLSLEYREAEGEYQNISHFNNMAEQLRKLLHIRKLENQHTMLQKEHKELMHEAGQISDKAEENKEQELKLTETVAAQKQRRPDMELLSAVRTWHQRNEQLMESQKEAAEESEDAKTVFAKSKENLLQLRNHPLLENLPANTADEQVEGFLKQEQEDRKKAIVRVEEKIAHLRIQQKLQDYASALKEGKPCPLCGAEEHPAPLAAAITEEDLAAVQKEKRVLEKENEKTGQLMQDFRLALLQAAEKHNLAEKARKKLLNRNEELAGHKESFNWPQYKKSAGVDKAFAEAKKLNEDIDAGEKQLHLLRKQREALIKKKDALETQAGTLKEKINAAATRAETLEQQITLLDKEAYAKRQNTAIEEEATALEQRADKAEIRFKKTREQLDKEKQHQQTLATRLEVNKESLAAESDSLKKTEEEIEHELSLSHFENIEEVKKILARNYDLGKEKEKIRVFRNKLNIQADREKELQAALEGKTYDGEEHRKMKDSIKEKGDAIDRMKKEQGKLAARRDDMKTKLETLAKLSKEEETLTHRAEDIKTLKQLFKASKFVEYISTIYLQELCRAANEKFFRLTRQQLSLELGEDNNFYVRDFINGGNVRSVKTLSGGQTFQAALSLALALADNIQKMSGSDENFFFLDEGFGSLDKETLQIVFDTLKALRKENRIVGIISHVGDMQQEIDAHLMVTLDEEKGSLVKSSLEF